MRLVDHAKFPPASDHQLDLIRARFVAGQLHAAHFSVTNEVVGRIIIRLEVAEQNAAVLQSALDDAKKQIDAARKEV